MTQTTPSAQQLEAYAKGSARRPPALFYQYTCADEAAAQACREALAALAPRHRGVLRWAGVEEQVLIGDIPSYRHACSIHFPNRDLALAFALSTEHGVAVRSCTSLRISVVTQQPPVVTRMSTLFSLVLPRLPYDRSVDHGPEPGLGVSKVIPTAQAIAELLAHPRQNEPVVMINWLKFRPQAAYAEGTEPASGRTAYHRYGKVALLATHRLGAKLLHVGLYQQVLVGNDGNPALKAWDEFALMQYPGRATFHLMSTLRTYRAALSHREAGLAPTGQGLAVTRPLPQFTWHR